MKIKIAEMYTVERDSKEIVMEERFMYCDPEGRAVDPHDIELRYNHNHDSKGRFASGSGGGRAAKSRKNSLTKKSASVRMGKKERALVVSEINTNYHSRYEGKKIGTYYSGTHSKKYRFEINGFDDYRFISARKIK